MRDLPAGLQDVVDAIGLADTVRLIEARPGERINVPKTLPADHWMIALIGMEKARTLSALLNGAPLSLPTSMHSGPRAARRACDDALASGATINEAVRASGLTYRAVQWRKAQKALPAPPASSARKRLAAPMRDLFDD